MRNLKKVGCLILCLALMMSVAIFNVGAAFSDQKDIQHTEAVGMCTALNIIGGYPDGSYKPAGNITRAEMCKMVCVALNGGEEPVLGTVTKHTFSDVQTDKNSAWAEPYIESCYSQGIVSGIGGGLFNPSGSITGSQAAKMLLVALGYQSDKASFTGASWEINVNVAASNRGLYKDLDSINPAAALTRDSAAQMIWNALQAYEVEYKTALSTDANGQITSTSTLQDKVVGSNSDKIDLMTDKYDTMDKDTTTGILTGISYNNTDGKYTYTLSSNNSDLLNNADNQTTATLTFKTTEDYTDLLGMNVCFVAKDKDTVYGAYAKDSSVIVSGYVGDITWDDAGTVNSGTGAVSGKQRIKVDGKYYDLDTSIVNGSANFAAGKTGEAAKYAKLVKYTESSNQTTFTPGEVVSEANGNALPMYYTYKAIDVDNDNDIDFIIYYPVAFGEITYVGSDYTRISVVRTYATDDLDSTFVANGSSYKATANPTTDIVGHIAKDSKTPTQFDTKDSTDYTLYEGATKEDYGMVAYDTTLKTSGTITKLDKMSENLDGVAGDNATLGGTVYDMSQLTALNSGKEVKVFGNTNLNKDQKFRTINGYLVWTDSNASSVDISDYVLVTGVAGSKASSGYYQADVMFTDGTKKTVDVKSVEVSATDIYQKGKTKLDTIPDTTSKYQDYDTVTTDVEGVTALKEGYLYTYEVSSGRYELTYAPKQLADTGFDSMDSYNLNGATGESTIGWTESDSASKANAKVEVKDSSGSTNARFNDDAVVFVQDQKDGDNTYTVKTGADLAKVTSKNVTVYYAGAENNDNDYPYVTFAYLKTNGIASTDVQYGFVTSDVTTSKDDDGTYYTMTVWNGTESVTLTTIDKADLDNNVNIDSLGKRSIIGYKLDTDGKISALSVYTQDQENSNTNGTKLDTASMVDGNTNTIHFATAIVNSDGSDSVTVVMPDGTKKGFNLDKDDTTILYIDRDGKKGETSGSITSADKADVTQTSEILNGMITLGTVGSPTYSSNNTYYYANAFVAYDKGDTDTEPTLDLLVVDNTNDFFNMN